MEKIISTPYGPIRFRPYAPTDEAAALSGWKAAFGQAMDPAIWRWKFHDNPYGRHMMMALNEANEVIAMYNGVPVAGNWQGRKVPFIQSMDHFSHPGYRRSVAGRKAIFVLLAEHYFDCWGGEEKGTGFVYGFPGTRHFKLGALFLRYTRLSPIRLFSWETRGRRRFRWSQKGSWEPLAFGQGHLDQLWEKCQPHYPISVIRNERFIRWRFAEHPFRNYWMKGFYLRGESLTAYVVGQDDGSICKIMDILVPPLAESLGAEMWRSLSRQLHQQGIRQIHLWLPENHFLASSLQASGIPALPDPAGAIATGISFDQGLPIKWAAQNFFFTQADLDLL